MQTATGQAEVQLPCTTEMRAPVDRTRERQAARFRDARTNARMSGEQMQALGNLSEPRRLLMKQAMEEFGLNARAYELPKPA